MIPRSSGMDDQFLEEVAQFLDEYPQENSLHQAIEAVAAEFGIQFDQAWMAISDSTNSQHIVRTPPTFFLYPRRLHCIFDYLRRLEPEFEPNMNGPDEWKCPLCKKWVAASYAPPGHLVLITMKEISHDADCPIQLLIENDAEVTRLTLAFDTKLAAEGKSE